MNKNKRKIYINILKTMCEECEKIHTENDEILICTDCIFIKNLIKG